MKDKDTQNEQLESILRKARLPEPSPELKERITAEAKRAWNQTLPELSWLVPFRRLAVSAAAAILIIWLANYSSERALAQWQSEKVPSTSEQFPGLESLPEIPYGPFVRQLATVNRQPSMIDASALNDHIEVLRHILDETQQSTITKPSELPGSRSHLISNPPSAISYS
jgi:hypothetical protein